MSEDELRDLVRKAYQVVNRAVCDNESGEGVDSKKLLALLDELEPALDLPWLPALARTNRVPWGRPP